MADLIERQAAIEAALDAIYYDEYWTEQVERAIGALPSAQPLTAYVISDEDGNIKCSNCGSFECWGNYCMDCGAKMDGVKDDG